MYYPHMVQTGMAAPYGGGVFPPPVNGVAGVVGAAGAAGEVKPPPPVPVKEDNSGAPQQPPPSGPQVPPPAGAPHPTAPGAPTAASFSPPPPPNGVDQQAISEVFQAAVAAAAAAAAGGGGQQAAPTQAGNETNPEGAVEGNALPVTSGATTPATATQGTDLKGEQRDSEGADEKTTDGTQRMRTMARGRGTERSRHPTRKGRSCEGGFPDKCSGIGPR